MLHSAFGAAPKFPHDCVNFGERQHSKVSRCFTRRYLFLAVSGVLYDLVAAPVLYLYAQSLCNRVAGLRMSPSTLERVI